MALDTVTKAGLDKRAEAKASAPRKPSKSERQKALAATVHQLPASVKVSETKLPAKVVDPKPEGEAKPKIPRRASETVVAFLAVKKEGVDIPDTSTIKLMPFAADKNPKRRLAGERFAAIKEGMTVGDYVKAMEAKGRKRRQTIGDLRWDKLKKFIDILPGKAVAVPAKVPTK